MVGIGSAAHLIHNVHNRAAAAIVALMIVFFEFFMSFSVMLLMRAGPRKDIISNGVSIFDFFVL